MKHHMHPKAHSIGIIHSHDGPTAVFVKTKVNPLAVGFAVGTLFGITVAFFAAISVHTHKKKNG